jgi:hypothetical protein
MFRIAGLVCVIASGAAGACPPLIQSFGCQQSFQTQSFYQQSYAPSVLAYPLSVLPIMPSITLRIEAATVQQELVPPARAVVPPVQQEQTYVPPAAAPLLLQVPQPTAIIQRQVFANYFAPPVLFNQCYSIPSFNVFSQRAIIRERSVQRQVIRQRSVRVERFRFNKSRSVQKVIIRQR